MVTGQLIVSISGLTDRTCTTAEGFCAQMDSRAVPVSLLVAPRLGGGYRLDADSGTVEWLTRRRESGAAIVLHGFDEAATKKRRGEFASLPVHEANLRLLAANRVLEHLNLATTMFAVPGWTVSPGTVKALPRNGFQLLAGLHSVTDLVVDRTVRARVVGIGNGFPDGPWWCRLVAATSERIARRGGVVRLTVGARQLREPTAVSALLDAVDVALQYGCSPQVYHRPLSFTDAGAKLSA